MALFKHVLRAGAGLCAGDAVKKLSEEGPDRIRQLLLDDGSDGVFANVPFDRDENGGKNQCHSHSFQSTLFQA
jgi:aspartate oxidase